MLHRIMKKAILLIFVILSAIQAKCNALWPPALGHENKPVIFWAHYMPMVSWGFLHCSNHAGGNIDVFPFYTQKGSKQEIMYRAMKSALDSGINGFQFLTFVPPEAFTAAAKIKKDTGKIFYIAYEGCGMGKDPEKAAKLISDFAKKAANSPYVYKIDNKPVIFFYAQGKWSGGKDSHKNTYDSNGVPEVRKILKKEGIEVVLIPTIGNFLKALFDRTDKMYQPFTPLTKGEYGSGKWLKHTNWDGVTSLNGGANARHDQITALKKLLKNSSKKFYVVPSIRTMYDSSNRWWQAIHCRGLGLRVIRRDLQQWLEAGFRLFTFSTWNDMMETMLMPSSRNPWGLNDLIYYYHSLAATGQSPFKTPHFVISYESEVLFGDQGFFQLLVLPEKDSLSCDYALNVDMKNIEGHKLLNFGNLVQIDGEIHDQLAETRYDTTAVHDKYLIMVPFVTIKQIDKSTGTSRVLYDNVRLAPIRIRYNKLHYHTPYTISLNHVDTAADLRLKWPNTMSPVINEKVGNLKNIELKVKSPNSFRRINLNNSNLSIGAFRADDLSGKQHAYFIRMTTSQKIKSVLTVKNGLVESVYHPHWNLQKALSTCGKSKAYFDISNTNNLPTVARIMGTPESKITLRLAGVNDNVLATTIKELSMKPLRTIVSDGKNKLTLDIRLTTDATDANIDYPLPPNGMFERTIPVQKGLGALRVFHAWGLTNNNLVCYSNPVAMILTNSSKLQTVNYIRTNGVFDDFVNDSSSLCANPFTISDVETAKLPSWTIPYVLIDFDEGCGKDVNHNGTAAQLGRGWLSGDCRWIKNGWKGSALQINNGTLSLRSKTMPHGSFTLSMRVKFKEMPKDRILFEDGDNWQMRLSGPLSLRIDPEGCIIAYRPCSGETACVMTKPLMKKGWNHIAVTYNLKELSIYINGKLSATKTGIKPAYQRTHSTPKAGSSKLASSSKNGKLNFDGQIDQLEIIGKALNQNEINQIFTEGKWSK